MLQTARMVDPLGYGVLESADQPTKPVLQDTTNPSPGELNPPRRGSLQSAAQARVAGRANAAAVPEKEVDELLSERAALIKKKYESSLSPVEDRRLTYVRWSIDRIEDARTGASLDMLESRVADYENFIDEIRSLTDEIARVGSHSANPENMNPANGN